MSISFISFNIFAIKGTKAEVPSCISLSNPKIGSTCYTEIVYNARVEHSKTPKIIDIPQAALHGFVIIDTRDFQESRIGTTEGPSVIVTRPGTALQIRQAYQQASQDFNSFYQRTESELRIRGINVGGMSEIRQRTEEQFSNTINQLIQIQSNREAIVVKGSAQAQWRTWLGVVEYTSGGTLRGKIRVYQRYVGTPEQANRVLSNAKNQILALVEQNSVSCPSSYSKQAFRGNTGQIAFFNEWNTPVVVVLYHPSNAQIFDRYTVPPGQNNFLGNNVIIGDDWGVCFENKPSSSTFVNNVGVVSDYNPNWQGKPLFMIQNPRIR